MSQVLRVGTYNGKYDFLNKDGRVSGEEYSMQPMDPRDADVLMERIRQGYVYVPGGYYVIRLELSGYTPDDNFEIVDLITFNTDDDGYHVPVTHKVITNHVWDAIMATGGGDTPASPTIQMAVFDYEAKTLRYVGDIFAETVTVSDPLVASRAQWSDSARIDILNNAIQIVMEGQPVHVMAVPVYFS